MESLARQWLPSGNVTVQKREHNFWKVGNIMTTLVTHLSTPSTHCLPLDNDIKTTLILTFSEFPSSESDDLE